MSLRETIARAIYSATYAKTGANYPTEPEEQADAAIRAFAESARKPEVVEAVRKAMVANPSYGCSDASLSAVNALLHAIGATEEEEG